MRIFDSLAQFHHIRGELAGHCARLGAARRAHDEQALARLNAETAQYAQEVVDAAMGIVEVLHTDVDPVAWRQFIKAITAQADADPDGTIGSVAGVVAAVEGAQLISALVARS
jgi:hypothetical protein